MITARLSSPATFPARRFDGACWHNLSKGALATFLSAERSAEPDIHSL